MISVLDTFGASRDRVGRLVFVLTNRCYPLDLTIPEYSWSLPPPRIDTTQNLKKSVYLSLVLIATPSGPPRGSKESNRAPRTEIHTMGASG